MVVEEEGDCNAAGIERQDVCDTRHGSAFGAVLEEELRGENGEIHMGDLGGICGEDWGRNVKEFVEEKKRRMARGIVKARSFGRRRRVELSFMYENSIAAGDLGFFFVGQIL